MWHLRTSRFQVYFFCIRGLQHCQGSGDAAGGELSEATQDRVWALLARAVEDSVVGGVAVNVVCCLLSTGIVLSFVR